MITYFLALFLSLFGGHINAPACGNNGTQVTTMDDDTGGETGHVPNQPTRPKPPTHP